MENREWKIENGKSAMKLEKIEGNFYFYSEISYRGNVARGNDSNECLIFSQNFWFFQLFPTEYFQNTRANSIIKQWIHLHWHSRMHCSPQNVIRFDRCYAYTRLQKHVQRAFGNASTFQMHTHLRWHPHIWKESFTRVIRLLDLYIFASNCIDVYVSHIKCTYACLYCVYACVWHLPISVGFFLQQTS